MEILLLTPQLPYPPHQGTSLRNYHILRGLAETNRMSLLSYTTGGANAALPPPLVSLCDEIRVVEAPERSTGRRLWQMVASSQPDVALHLNAPPFAAALAEMLQERPYDVVQIEGIELAWTIPVVRSIAPRARLIYDAHNAETLLQRRAGQADRGRVSRWPAVLYSALQSRRLRRYEAWVIGAVDAVTAVSEADRTALLELAAGKPPPVTVIPNTIDVEATRQAAASMQAAGTGEGYDLVFSGKMDYRPNVDAVLWFADEIWPLVRAQNPGASWAIVGQRPHNRLARLSEVPGVTVTGWVADVIPYLAGAKVCIMPFRVGSGTRLKLIEALAAGRAVVSTAVGVEGFPIENGREALIANAPADFATAVSGLLADENLRAHLGAMGQRFAQNYDWRAIVPLFEKVYLGAGGPAGSAPSRGAW